MRTNTRTKVRWLGHKLLLCYASYMHLWILFVVLYAQVVHSYYYYFEIKIHNNNNDAYQANGNTQMCLEHSV